MTATSSLRTKPPQLASVCITRSHRYVYSLFTPPTYYSAGGSTMLSNEVLRLHLQGVNLVTTGRRVQLIKRLTNQIRAQANDGGNAVDSQPSQDDDSPSGHTSPASSLVSSSCSSNEDPAPSNQSYSGSEADSRTIRTRSRYHGQSRDSRSPSRSPGQRGRDG